MSKTPVLDYIEQIAHLKRCMSERDAEIAALRQQVAELEAQVQTERARYDYLKETMTEYIAGIMK